MVEPSEVAPLVIKKLVQANTPLVPDINANTKMASTLIFRMGLIYYWFLLKGHDLPNTIHYS